MVEITPAELFPGRRELEERLTNAQRAMMLQEESIKHSERERGQLVERIGAVERTLTTAEDEKRIIQVTRLTCYTPALGLRG